jgi:hypothetical protein
VRASTPLLAGVTLLALLACGAFGACGCSKPKQADDPTNESTHRPPPDDGTTSTKWEGATTPPPSETKPHGDGTSVVNEAVTRRTDEYDKEATEEVVKRAARQAKENCGAAKDDSGKAVGPWGKATLQIQLGHNGHSKGLTIPAPFQGKPTGKCLEKAFAKLTFPPWAGSDTEISWEFELVPVGAPEKK